MKDTRSSQQRPAASLTGALLARRGGARPAMRRQPIIITANANHGDDLGWNGRGDVAREVNVPADKPSRAKRRTASPVDVERKVAFTLRIDAERHLRLRLMSVLSNRSAQRLLTEALDYMIAQSDALNAVMERMESSAVAAAGEKKLKI